MPATASGSVMVPGVGQVIIKGLMNSRFMVVGVDTGETAEGLYGAQDYTSFLWKCFLFEIWRRHFERGFQESESALEISRAAKRDPAAR
jgi:hypothetical protein